jgi:hypothetical protein
MNEDRFHFSFDDFCTWLCEHEAAVVGRPGIGYNDPLSEWLSCRLGRVYGVDGKRYGPARLDPHAWRFLPLWCQLFIVFTERYMFARPLTGVQVFNALAQLEQQYRVLSL